MRTDLEEVGNPPRIKYQRMTNRHAVTPLRPQLAAQESELQRMNAFDARRAGKDGERIENLGTIDAGNHRAAHDGLDVLVGVIAPPGVGIDAHPGLLRHQRMPGAGVFEIVFVHVWVHRHPAHEQILVVFRTRQRR